MNIVKVPIDRVQPWDKNPRSIKAEDYDRLKRQILKLGVYKPLLAYKEKGGYVVLGGNMRVRALKELGVKEVEISVVEAGNEAEKVAISLSDNDRAGYYDEQALAELLYEQGEAVDRDAFRVDLGADDSLARVIETMGETVVPTLAYPMKAQPGGPVICPNCGAVAEEGHGTEAG